MGKPSQNREALRLALSNIAGLTAYARAPGDINCPAAVVEPGPIVYGETFRNGTHAFAYTIVVLVADTDSDLAQQQLDDYLATSGDRSILAAIEGSGEDADRTLGGVVDWAVVRGVQTYGLIEYAGRQYVGARLPVEVQTDDS